jgi:hypothetical protein
MNGTLKQAIRGMLKDARAAVGRPILRSLAGVFTLSVTQLDTGQVSVTLERANKAPTEAEWERILAQWPESVPADVTPRPRSEGRRHALVASWPRPVEASERV